jgi:hypothetical protein
MQKHLGHVAVALLTWGGLALAQAPAQTPPPEQMTPQVLAEMLRSATTFHELVRNMNLDQSLGQDQHVPGPDGRFHHPLARTAETVGAGAGVGAAIGSMTHRPNGVLIGALIGGAGGFIVDQIVKHREEVKEKAAYSRVPDADASTPDRSRGFKDRDGDSGRH